MRWTNPLHNLARTNEIRASIDEELVRDGCETCHAINLTAQLTRAMMRVGDISGYQTITMPTEVQA